MYKLEEITDKNTWNNFIFENEFEFYSFLCSWEWTKFQEKSWNEVLKYWIYRPHPNPLLWEEREQKEKKELIWILPLIIKKAKRWTYLFAPHTPLIKKSEDFFEVLKTILKDLKNIARKNKANFIRFNSPVKNSKENKKSFKSLGFIDAPMHEHAEDTHLLDLKKSEEELLWNMKKGDRYYINRAIKEWVEIVKWNTQEQKEILANMHLQHSKKVWYHPFSKKFINYLYEVFPNNITTISARFEGEVESILMTIRFWKTCVYYIAASDIKHSKFSPNYLCQWEAIKQAKQDWCEIYNFWWVSPDNNPTHPIAWVTKFKRKFWGYDYSLLHAQDLVISPKYWFNFIIETIRRKKRWYYYKKPE